MVKAAQIIGSKLLNQELTNYLIFRAIRLNSSKKAKKKFPFP
jgi:hypothetical protein